MSSVMPEDFCILCHQMYDIASISTFAILKASIIFYRTDWLFGRFFFGENTWIGAGVIIVPGVHIGRNTVIGAGSPCRVLRNVSEHDHEFFYKSERIDWENL